jgi:hypothetical protein
MAEVKNLEYRLPLIKEVVKVKSTIQAKLDRILCQKKNLKTPPQAPKPTPQAVIWVMKQLRYSTVTMVRNMEAPHHRIPASREALKIKLKTQK